MATGAGTGLAATSNTPSTVAVSLELVDVFTAREVEVVSSGPLPASNAAAAG